MEFTARTAHSYSSNSPGLCCVSIFTLHRCTLSLLRSLLWQGRSRSRLKLDEAVAGTYKAQRNYALPSARAARSLRATAPEMPDEQNAATDRDDKPRQIEGELHQFSDFSVQCRKDSTTT